MSTTAGELDIQAMSDAMRRNDAAALAAFYAPDAQIVMIDKDHPPSAPQRLEGIDAIRAMYEDVCGRALRHDVTHQLSAPGVAAYSEVCEYPDGIRVMLASVMEVRDGQITSQRYVQAWDE
jgi:ketosteroid isomerase-like protein